MTAITSKYTPTLVVGLAILLGLAPGCARKVSTAVEDQSFVTATTQAEAPPPAAAPEPEAQPPAPPVEPPAPEPPAAQEQQAAAPIEPPPPAEPQVEPQPATEPPPPAPPAMEETRVAETPMAPSEAPPAPPVAEPTPVPEPAAQGAEVADVYFDFDQFGLRSDAKAVLEANVRIMQADGATKWLIEGHCDERGSLAYNIVLGERRAESVKRYLEDLGIAPAQLQIVSYGKERPFCKEHSEACWQSNRRAHFVRR